MIGGVPGGINPLGGARGSSASGKINPSLAQLLNKHAGLKSVLQGLGIKPSSVSNVKSQQGMLLNSALAEVQLVAVTKEQSHVLQTLGLAGAEVAIMIQSAEEMEALRKRFKELKEADLNREETATILGALGMGATEDTVILKDETGGIVVIQAGIEEIRYSLEDEAEEPEELDE